MDLANPVQSVIPSVQGAVLSVLARTDEPLSGRRVAELTRPRFAQTRVNAVLQKLADSGIVLRESRPPANLYRLNQETRGHRWHPSMLADMWATVLSQDPGRACELVCAAGGRVAVRLRGPERSEG